MESVGWVGPDVWFAHGIHFNDDELRVLAQTGTGVAHCPISNMKLSSGVARVSDMLKLGIPVGLGVDGSASNDGSSLLEEMRVGFLLHRLNESYNAPTGYDLLKIATRGGAKVLGRPEIGQLASGKAADLFMIETPAGVGLSRRPRRGAPVTPSPLKRREVDCTRVVHVQRPKLAEALALVLAQGLQPAVYLGRLEIQVGERPRHAQANKEAAPRQRRPAQMPGSARGLRARRSASRRGESRPAQRRA